MRLESERQGRWLARRVLFKLAKAGTEKCRADVTRHRLQCLALHVAFYKLQQKGSREARDGFASLLCDALGTRSLIEPGELAHFYERMECEARFRQRDKPGSGRTGDNVPIE